jgi:uncharacterized membrane-anchored protein
VHRDFFITLYFVSAIALVKTVESLYSKDTTQWGIITGVKRSAEYQRYKWLRSWRVRDEKFKLARHGWKYRKVTEAKECEKVKWSLSKPCV